MGIDIHVKWISSQIMRIRKTKISRLRRYGDKLSP
jgi:hypothetical protein